MSPSIVKFKQNVNIDEKFKFRDISPNEMKTYVHNLDPTKASIENDIPAKILIGTDKISSTYLSDIYNHSKTENCHPLLLKCTTITPIDKKGTKTIKKTMNYRPLSLIPSVSKLFERHMHEEIISYVERYLSTYLFGFRCDHSTEYCLLVMVEMWKKVLDNKKRDRRCFDRLI